MSSRFFTCALALSLLIGACNSNKPSTTSTPPPVDTSDQPADQSMDQAVEDRADLPAAWKNKLDAGVDFIAMGNEPSWALDIDFDRVMRFQSLGDNANLSAPVPEAVRPADVNAISYRTQTSAGQLQVTIFADGCTDNMSGDRFPYRVQVTTKSGTVEGCGRYLTADPLRAKWELVSLNGKAVKDNDFSRGRPVIDLKSQKGRITGNAGCNSISGTYELQADKLVIGPMVTTKMACPELDKERQILSVLSGNEVSYNLLPGLLELRKGGERLEFRPAKENRE